MGEIRKDNLHESLIEELNELANIDLSGKQDKTDESLLTESKDVIGAINELFQSANNGKELIANAIGEPLDASDTFSAMSNDINGLLSTFKTNMMNNGIAVESGDKFKTLIDKIATMVDEGNGKGIQFAEGSSNVTVGMSESKTIAEDIGFVPTIAFAVIGLLEHGVNYNFKNFNNAVISSCATTKYSANDSTIQLIISNESLQIKTTSSNASNATGFQIYSNNHIQWYAIGVGEEDTTLRDSLANILQEEGVSVTEEDDMASLITKVDDEFTAKNAEIAARVLPAGNATAANVESGKTFINSTGKLVTGTANIMTVGTNSTGTNVALYCSFGSNSTAIAAGSTTTLISNYTMPISGKITVSAIFTCDSSGFSVKAKMDVYVNNVLQSGSPTGNASGTADVAPLNLKHTCNVNKGDVIKVIATKTGGSTSRYLICRGKAIFADIAYS